MARLKFACIGECMIELNHIDLMTGTARLGFAGDTCPIPDVCIDERRLPLLIARATLRDLIAGLA